MVTDTPDDTAAQRHVTQDVHHTTKEAPPEPQVVKVKKEAPPIKIVSYHHSHHPIRQQSFKKENGNQQLYGPRW